VCAGQRDGQEGSSPSGARMRGAVSKSGGRREAVDVQRTSRRFDIMKDAGDGICTRTGPLKGSPPVSKTGASANSATPAFISITTSIGGGMDITCTHPLRHRFSMRLLRGVEGGGGGVVTSPAPLYLPLPA
jgi:hypothetical protein